MTASPAPELTPIMLGAHRSLSVTVWRRQPATASAAPAKAAASTRGKRNRNNITYAVWSLPANASSIRPNEIVTLPNASPNSKNIIRSTADIEHIAAVFVFLFT